MTNAVYANDIKRGTFARKLARQLGLIATSAPRMRAELKYRLLNWGSSTEPQQDMVEWVGNTPEAVKRMSNKLLMFQTFAAANVPCLEWTDNWLVAQDWSQDGHIVYERAKLTGHSGEGIRVIKDQDVDPDVPLFTKDIGGKFREYRVHVVNGEIVASQLKRKMSPEALEAHGFAELDNERRRQVRIYRNGWVFCVNDFVLPPAGAEVALAAMRAVDGVTGAVDIAVRANGEALVIETNSAPALRSVTVLAAYTEALPTLFANA